jgi:hypothetical protein
MKRLFPCSSQLQPHPIYHYAWIMVLIAAAVDAEPFAVTGPALADDD